MSISRLSTAFLIGRDDNAAHQDALLLRPVVWHVALFLIPLFIAFLVLLLLDFSEKSLAISGIAISIIMYGSLVLSGYLTGLLGQIKSSKIIFLSTFLKLLVFFTLLSGDYSPIFAYMLAEVTSLLAFLFALDVNGGKHSFLGKESLVCEVNFRASNFYRALRENAVILLISSGALVEGSALESTLVFLISLLSTLLTVQSVLSQSHWREFSGDFTVVSIVYRNITFSMLSLYAIVLVFAVGVIYVENAFSFWLFFVFFYFFVVFATGPKFFLSKERRWRKLETVELVFGVVALSFLYFPNTDNAIAVFYLLISAPHLYGFYYVKKRLNADTTIS